MQTRKALVLLTSIPMLAAFAARPAEAGGFAFFDQGGKAAGMGGAFVAQADDPSAIFYNIGGLAFMSPDDRTSLGLTVLTLNESLYQGLPPGPGAGTAAAQDEPMTLHPHVYLTFPIGDRTRLGLGIFTPFYFKTQWLAPESFAGRFVATAAEIQTYDVNLGVSHALTPRLGFGAGLYYRTSEVSLDWRFLADNPFTGGLADAGTVAASTDSGDGIGWNLGVFHQVTDRISWGFAFRSDLDVDYSATGNMTQIPTGNEQLDELYAASLPFGQDLAATTAVAYPETFTLGVALDLTKAILLAVDVEWTAWSGFDRLALAFRDTPVLDQTIPQGFADTMTTRVGIQYGTATGTYFRFGIALDESPQPDRAVGPLLADADRTVFTFGFGRVPLDLAFVWEDADQRVISNQVDGLNGSYRSSTWKLVGSFTF